MPNPQGNALFINRELSWLEFNRRVLELSREKAVPLGEQLNFAAIYASNLDEFFMIRVGSLYDQTLLKSEIRENKTKLTAQQQIDVILPKVAELQKVCDKVAAKLHEGMATHGLCKIDFSALGKPQQQFWKKYFLREYFPVLSPQIIDRRHPFPFLRNMEIYVGALIKEKKNSAPVFGLIPVSNQFERLIFISEDGAQHFALVEELILHFASLAFGDAEVQAKCLFRVTRNADLNVEEGMFDHDIDYRVIMGELLKKRRKQAAVRVQFQCDVHGSIQDYLLEKLVLPRQQVILQSAPLEMSYMYKLAARLRREEGAALFYPPARALQPGVGFDLYNTVLQRDVLICYPYHSMRPFIRMLFKAAADPDVISIKMTLYRVASDSQVIEALIAAAENGKEVVTIVELRARFDEQNNIDWSRQLEQAGCTVIYGFSDYKVHSKLTLITRRKGAHFEYLSAIGTGNYNEKTSELYTDLNYLTVDSQIGEEVGGVFNDLAMERLTHRVDRLIVAPLMFKSVLLDEMRREIQRQQESGDGSIVLKCNSISDKTVIETLSEASIAGVPVQMVVRGICCMQAGVPGLSENIRVHSMVGRFLEHSRIFAFGQGQRMRIYIASGDFLTRNTERRVEVGVRIDDDNIKQMLWDILQMQLADNVNTSVMQPDGSYKKIKLQQGEKSLNSQMEMYPCLAQRQAKETAAMAEETPQVNNTAAPEASPSPEKRNWWQRVFGRGRSS